MKKVNCSARILRVSPVFAPDGSPLYRRGRLITHRAILAASPSFEAAIKAAASLKRLSPEEAAKSDRQFSDRPASFCLKRNDGLYAIDLNANQIGLVTGGRMPAALFQFVAPHATLNITVELRDIGDVVVDRAGQELKVEQGHAAIQDLSATFPPHIEAQLLNAITAATMSNAAAGFGFAAGTPTGGSAFSVPADVPIDEADMIGHPSVTETTAHVARDTAETVSIGAEEEVAPVTEQRQQSETVSKASAKATK